jgi:hypothetical protein
MSGSAREPIVDASQATDPRDVTEMLNQFFTTADIAADHQRTLLAEAKAQRLAREAAAASRSGDAERATRLPKLALPRPWHARSAT